MNQMYCNIRCNPNHFSDLQEVQNFLKEFSGKLAVYNIPKYIGYTDNIAATNLSIRNDKQDSYKKHSHSVKIHI